MAQLQSFCKRVAVAALLAAVLAVAASGGTSRAGVSAETSSKSAFTLGIVGAIANLDPQPASAANFMLRRAVFDTLVNFVNGKPVPDLATKWKLNASGLAMTFTLRPGVRFTDGKTFTGKDVCANLTWAQNPANQVQGGGLLAGIKCASPKSSVAVLRMLHRVPELLTVLVNTPIMDLASGKSVATSPVGTGPYKFVALKPGSEIDMTRNPTYWGRPAILPNYTVRMFSDATAAILALKSGQIDALQSPPYSQISSLRSASGVVIKAFPGYGNFQYILNVTKPPLTDARVRQAISYAIDRNAFSTLTGGLARPSSDMWPPDSAAYGKADDHPVFDLTKAKALLAQAGYPNGFTVDVSTSQQSYPEFAAFNPILQADLAKIGVTANLHDLDASTLDTNTAQGQYQGLVTNIYAFSNLDPGLAFASEPFRPVGNAAQYTSAAYTSMVSKAENEGNPAKRIADYQAIARYAQQEAWQITVATNPIVFALRTSVRGFRINSYGMPLVALFSKSGG